MPRIRSILARRWKAPATVVAALVAIAMTAGMQARAAATPTPPFTQCPAVGASPSCKILLIVNADDSVSVYGDPAVGDYDGGDDTLVGIENQSSRPVPAVTVTGPGSDLSGFDGDGLCTYLTCEYSAPTGYEGPLNTFTTSPALPDSAEVDFANAGLAPGASTYFSLEGTLTAAQVTARKGTLKVEYAALGDSYSSGEGNPPFDPVTDTDTDRCHRSKTAAYEHYLAVDDGLNIDQNNVKFVACSGAQRKDVWIGGFQGEDTQFAAVTPATDLITISVGGNDIGFVDVLNDCVTGPKAKGSADCADKPLTDPDTHKQIKLKAYENKLVDQLGKDTDLFCYTPTGYRECSPPLHAMYETLAAGAAPGVRIRVLLYPHVFTTKPAKSGCDLRFVKPFNEHISEANMRFINDGVDLLNDKIKSEVHLAATTGVDIEAVDPTSAFDDDANGASPGGHGVCTKAPWINGLILAGTTPSPYSFHPNATGQRVFADRMKATL